MKRPRPLDCKMTAREIASITAPVTMALLQLRQGTHDETDLHTLGIAINVGV